MKKVDPFFSFIRDPKEIDPPAARPPPPWCLRKHAVQRKLACAALPAWTDTSLTYPAHTGLQIRVAGRRMRLLSCRRQAPCAGRGLCLGLSHFTSLSNAASVDCKTGAQEAGLKMIRHRPVVFKEGEAPILGLFLMCLKEHVPDDFREWTEPPLIIRKRTGSSAPSVPYEGGPRGRGWVCFAGWRAPLLAHST